MKKFISLFLSMLLPMAVMAAYIEEGTIDITVGGSTRTVPVQIDYLNHAVILGNGRNACIPHYLEGTVFIPGTHKVQGYDFAVNVGTYAFRMCSGITQVTIGEGSTSIGDCAFVGCSKLEKVTLPASLSRVGRAAFAGLKSLKYMECKGSTAPTWSYNDVFYFYGSKRGTSRSGQNRTLYVPAQAIDSYNNTNYGDTIGWKDAFARIYERTSDAVAIGSKAELKTFREKVNNGTTFEYYDGATSFELTADIEWDFDTDGQWIPIGTTAHPFDGCFDGNGHKITGLKMNATSYCAGLFGYADNAFIHNLYLENPQVYGTDYTGAVLGYCNNYTRVSDVLVTSNAGSGDFTVRATGSAGGIVGFVKNGVIERCYFEGRVWSHQGWAGGIVGHMQNGKVEDCAAGSYVANLLNSDNWRLGGIVGGTYGSYTPGQVNVTINRCLAWSNFIIEGNYSPGEKMSYSGWILGYASVPTEITNCAYYVDPDKRSYEIYGGSTENINVYCDNNAINGDNATYTTFNSLMERNTEPYLGNDNWYYFTEGFDNYPVPSNLKDMYLANMVYDIDDKGIIYLPVHDESNQIVAYKVKGQDSNVPLDTWGGILTKLEIPATHKDKPVTEIMPKAFAGRTDLDILQLGNSATNYDSNITAIGDSACMASTLKFILMYCQNLTTIGNSAFEDCDSLIEVRLPNSVTTVHKRAFRGCDDLHLFIIGSGFKDHDDNFIAYCPNLDGLYLVEPGNTSPNSNGYLVVNNMLLHNVGNYRSYVVACSPGVSGDVVLPVEYLTNSEVNIFGSSFASCDKVTSVTIPANKKYSMGKGVFDGCHNIRYIDMRGAQRFEKENGQPLPWNVERNDPQNSFYGLSERTIIWTDATTTCEESEVNVVAGNHANSLLLTDGWDFVAKAEFTAGSASLNRVLGAKLVRDEYEENGEIITNTYYESTGFSVYLPYPLTLTGDNVKVYEPVEIFTEDNNTIVSFREVEGGEMEAYKPYYVVVDNDEVSLDSDGEVTVTLQPDNIDEWADLGYIFSGTTVTIPNSTLRTMGAYILQSDNMWHRVPADKELENVYVGPFRSYFHSTTSNAAAVQRLLSQFVNNGSETTDVVVIKTVDNNGDEHYYDLNGRVLPGKPNSGIYIHQGKKYVGH